MTENSHEAAERAGFDTLKTDAVARIDAHQREVERSRRTALYAEEAVAALKGIRDCAFEPGDTMPRVLRAMADDLPIGAHVTDNNAQVLLRALARSLDFGVAVLAKIDGVKP